jgi:SAM-dependent methyltransferase
MSVQECLVCQQPAVEEVSAFSVLPRITSDCRPYKSGGRLGICAACGAVQKFADAVWFDEIREIYSVYFANHQAGGEEQLVLDPAQGTLTRRSDLIVRHLKHDLRLAPQGSALDVGSGSGGMLRSMSDELRRWRLCALDIDARQEERLQRIPRFERIFTGSIADVAQKFDLATMVHSLEHFPSPRQALIDLKPKLARGGRLFVEVVDCAQNPFDLLVADHIIHFDQTMLGHLVERAGYGVAILRNDWVLKELSLVATPRDGEALVTDPPREVVRASQDRVRHQLAWLAEMVDSAEHSARDVASFGIFGTSIAATWLTGFLADRIDFYVDEDRSRVGQIFMGKPVLDPCEVAAEAVVFVALSPALAVKIGDRMKSHGFRTVLPPVFSDMAGERTACG